MMTMTTAAAGAMATCIFLISCILFFYSAIKHNVDGIEVK